MYQVVSVVVLIAAIALIVYGFLDMRRDRASMFERSPRRFAIFAIALALLIVSGVLGRL